MSSLWARLKTFGIYVLVLVSTIVALDTILFFSLDNEINSDFPGYREGFYVEEHIGKGYPLYYFEKHPERGFDIKPTSTPRTDQIHEMTDDYSYPVWSNKLGCFDTPVDKPKSPFWYMAGDSIIWGHAKFETLMGTRLEKALGIEILQCGVTHTGQRHQFSKFLDITKKLGQWPDLVLVFYSPTDTANDYLYPHTTVVNGGLADTKKLTRDNDIVTLDDGWYKRFIEDHDHFSMSRFLMTFSMTAQIFNAGLHKIRHWIPWSKQYIGTLGVEPGLPWYDKYFLYKGQRVYDLHRMTIYQTQNGRMKYENYKFANNNKEIIREWRDHAIKNNYKLVFVLMLPGPSWFIDAENNRNDFYKELREYLDNIGVKYFDMVDEVTKRDIEIDDLMWETDIHMSEYGNKVVANILLELLGKKSYAEQKQ